MTGSHRLDFHIQRLRWHDVGERTGHPGGCCSAACCTFMNPLSAVLWVLSLPSCLVFLYSLAIGDARLVCGAEKSDSFLFFRRLCVACVIEVTPLLIISRFWHLSTFSHILHQFSTDFMSQTDVVWWRRGSFKSIRHQCQLDTKKTQTVSGKVPW